MENIMSCTSMHAIILFGSLQTRPSQKINCDLNRNIYGESGTIIMQVHGVPLPAWRWMLCSTCQWENCYLYVRDWSFRTFQFPRVPGSPYAQRQGHIWSIEQDHYPNGAHSGTRWSLCHWGQCNPWDIRAQTSTTSNNHARWYWAHVDRIHLI